ncbi:hypothetical protein XpopCFBP1817_06310 [Xanthomonas populi]|uniref:Uncharacterized protein n=1 Tax=Xanthomonas populi TaxID=53414 RepID=A0A2S7EUC2_9XANT|nr:hypothetical protein XpopCFBP1817_06310 [Xanthomonas populi]
MPAHRRGTFCGMDAAEEPPWTDSRRGPRWWVGKGPAAKPQISRFPLCDRTTCLDQSAPDAEICTLAPPGYAQTLVRRPAALDAWCFDPPTASGIMSR